MGMNSVLRFHWTDRFFWRTIQALLVKKELVMVSQKSLKLQQSPLGALAPECWKLVPDRALTLRADTAGVLRVSQGRVWVTADGPHQGPANDWGDVVLHSGEQLLLQPGRQVVVEAYGEAVNQAAFFSWEPSPPRPGIQTMAAVASVPWGDVLARPLLPLGRGGSGWLSALGTGLMRAGCLLSWLVPGRGRVLSPMEFNQP